MDQACDSLRQVAAGLQQCLEEEAPREKKYVLLLKGLACIAELKNQNQRLCEETERVRLFSMHQACMLPNWYMDDGLSLREFSDAILYIMCVPTCADADLYS